MKKNKEQLCAAISEQINRLLSDSFTRPGLIKSHSVDICKKHNIRVSDTTDYLSRRKTLLGASILELFALLESLKPNDLSKYFTDKEIELYKDVRLEEKQIEYPLTLPVVQVASDQWIGTIDIQTLMLFRDAQLINYNTNTQRSMTLVKRGGAETYTITLNKKAVKAIKESYERGIYIPNTITLNIPAETEFEFARSKSGETVLKFTNIDHFDILDGYHRYIAMCEMCNETPDFNYQMEVRFVAFREKKAKQFIWQEDQKTKMSRVEAESFNTHKASNNVVENLRSGPYSSVVGTVIDPAALANAIDYTYLKGKTTCARSVELATAKQIEDDLALLERNIPDIFDKTWGRKRTYAIIYCIWSQMYNPELRLIEELEKEAPTIMNPRTVMRLQKYADAIRSEVVGNE